MTLSAVYDVVGIAGTMVSIGGTMWSRRAAKLSAPTGNGFAKTVLTTLIRIEERQDRMETRLDQLAAADDNL